MSIHWCFGSLLLIAGVASIACGVYFDKDVTREEYMRLIGTLCVISGWVILLGTSPRQPPQSSHPIALAVPIDEQKV